MSSDIPTYLSTTSSGAGANEDSSRGSLSADGKKLLFQSKATNFITGDSNGSSDLFIKDIATGVVTRVSTTANGSQANGDSFAAQFVPGDKKILFTSDATNLLADGGAGRGIYLKDLGTGAVQRVAANVVGEGVLSADGSKVAFISDAANLVPGDTNGKSDLFIKDLATGTVTRASVAVDGTQANSAVTSVSSLSADGTKVVFQTKATNLGGDPDTSDGWFVKDLNSGKVTALEVPPPPEGSSSPEFTTILSPSLSPDGTKVAFNRLDTYRYYPFPDPESFDQTVVSTVYIKDLVAGDLKVFYKSSYVENIAPEAVTKFSADGTSLVFPKYVNFAEPFAEMWIADLTVKGVEKSAGFYNATDYQISPDGSKIVYTSSDDNYDTTDRNNFDDIYSIPVSFGAPSVTAVTAMGSGLENGSGSLTVGQTVSLTLALSQPVTVKNGSAIVLKLNSGGRAVFDAAASNSQNLVFKYVVRPDEVTPDLRVAEIERNGATIRDAAGREANLSGTLQPIPGTLKVNGCIGTSAAETFNGTTGAETFIGLGGNDKYLVNNADDQVIEYKGEGTDTIVSTISYVLASGQSVEILQLAKATGTTALDLQGNEFDQTLRGNAGDNVLNGAGGIDIAIGGLGNDTYRVDNARDVVVEAAGEGNDTLIATVSYALAAGVSVETLRLAALTGTTALDLTGNEVSQTLYGNKGANTINGGGGTDTMIGDAGNDTYGVDSADDRVIEAVGGGTDTVVTKVSYILAAGQEIETLQLAKATGTAGLTLTGNEFGQTIRGNGGDNVLDGKGGVDTLIGGSGNDTYGVDNAGDRVIEAVGGGNDTVVSATSYTLAAGQEIEALQLARATGKAGLALTGNEFGQSLSGNDGNNVLAGKGGADVLLGKGGADTFVFDTALGATNVDRIVDFSHADDTIQLSRVVFGLGDGTQLPAAWFKEVGATPGTVIDRDDRLIYDSRDGKLFYDSNGSDAGGRTLVAILENRAMIDHTDFLIA